MLTLVSIPISQPAMLTPASQTALACAARVDTSRERKAMLITVREMLRSGLASKVERIVAQGKSSRQEEEQNKYLLHLPHWFSYARTSVIYTP